MYEYTINVAAAMDVNALRVKYRHLFTTQPQQLREEDAVKLAEDIAWKFPAPEFNVTLSRRSLMSQSVEVLAGEDNGFGDE